MISLQALHFVLQKHAWDSIKRLAIAALVFDREKCGHMRLQYRQNERVCVHWSIAFVIVSIFCAGVSSFIWFPLRTMHSCLHALMQCHVNVPWEPRKQISARTQRIGEWQKEMGERELVSECLTDWRIPDRIRGETSHPASGKIIPGDFQKPYKKNWFLGILALTKSIGF